MSWVLSTIWIAGLSVTPLFGWWGRRRFLRLSLRSRMLVGLALASVLMLAALQWRTDWSVRSVVASNALYALASAAFFQGLWLLTLLLPLRARSALSWWIFVPLVLSGMLLFPLSFLLVSFLGGPPQAYGTIAPGLDYRVDGFGAAFTEEGADVRLFSSPSWLPIVAHRWKTQTFVEGDCDTNQISVIYMESADAVVLTCAGEHNSDRKGRREPIVVEVQVPR